jgi:glutamine amidotransferase-like uncharacterized protein
VAIIRNKVFCAPIAVVTLTVAACRPAASGKPPEILLFGGSGTTPGGVRAIESILKARHLDFVTVNSEQMNRMSGSELSAYRLLIIPGGNYLTIGNSLTPNTTASIRGAVQGGLNYLGICAGGLLAGNAPGNHLNLTSGVHFDFYAAVNRGIHKTAVAISCVGAPAVEHYWEDGPQFAGWGAAVGRYPDGTPAIVEGRSGKGWVLLCGVHPEAPETWRRGMTFSTPASVANAYAGVLIDAALTGTELPHY